MSIYTIPPDEPGRELGSVEKTDADWTTTNTAATDITAMSLTFTVVSRPVYVWFGASDMLHTVSGTLALLLLNEDTTVLNFFRATIPGNSFRVPLGALHAVIRTPGSHTVKLQTQSSAAGTIRVPASVNNPIFLRAIEA